MNRTPTEHDAHFERLHRDDADPWGVEGRWYEERKRALTLACLPHERYGAAFEPGCSIGALSRELARERCDRVLGVDASASAIERARGLAADLPGVELAVMRVPEEWPEGRRFDLVVISELGSYLTPKRFAHLVERTRASLQPGGAVVACHWRHHEPDHEQEADDVHGALRRAPGFDLVVEHREADFLLDVLVLDEVDASSPR